MMYNGRRKTLLAQGRSRTQSGSARIMYVVALFVCIWLAVVWFLYSFLQSMNAIKSVNKGKEIQRGTGSVGASAGDRPGASGNDGLSVSSSAAAVAVASGRSALERAQQSNKWYGWQIETAHEMACSWRSCFKEDHDCQTCRDSQAELGEAPLAEQGWIPDVTMLRRMMLDGKDADGNPWPPMLDDELCEPIGVFGGKSDDNGNALKATGVVAQPMVSDASKNGPRIMCMVYTMAENHATNIRAIRETWGGGCDGFLAFSTQSDPRLPAISIPHDGIEDYYNMWQKIRSMWRFVGKHYLTDFDWFLIGGEDMYVIPQNLRSYLASVTQSPEELHFVGRRFKGYGHNNYFNSGGAGYALSRGTLRKLYNEGLDHPKCNPNRKTSMEDVMIAECLREVFDIGLTDTRDGMKRERFHPFAPASHYKLKPDPTDWYDKYNAEWGILYGKDCCAPDSVSYHYMKKPAMVRHIHALLYYCNK